MGFWESGGSGAGLRLSAERVFDDPQHEPRASNVTLRVVVRIVRVLAPSLHTFKSVLNQTRKSDSEHFR